MDGSLALASQYGWAHFDANAALDACQPSLSILVLDPEHEDFETIVQGDILSNIGFLILREYL